MLIRISIPHRPKAITQIEKRQAAPEPGRDHSATRVRAAPKSRLSGSSRVGIGILGSRITGLLRERVIGYYFGIETVWADAFRAAIRIPNLLNNLFGEGVLSASFVCLFKTPRGATGRRSRAPGGGCIWDLVVGLLGCCAARYFAYAFAD